MTTPQALPEQEREQELIHTMLSDLAGIDTFDTNLRDHPGAWQAVETMLAALRAPEGAPAREPSEHTAAERKDFEREAEAMGFDIQRMICAAPEPWSEYADPETGHRWGGWLAGVEWAASRAALAEPSTVGGEPVAWDEFIATLERIRPLSKRHAGMLKAVKKYRLLDATSTGAIE